MAEIKKYSRMTEDLLVYGGDTTKTPTSMQMMMDFMIQEADSVGDLVDAILWQPSKTYSVKEVVHSSNMPKGYVAECKQAGQSGNNEPQWNASTKSYSDGTVKWELKNAIGGDGVAIGMIIPFASNGDIPAGYLLCNGASVNKVTYPDLFNSIGYTYGGSGEYFKLPNLTDKFIEGSGIAGTNKEAGLPNIEGAVNNLRSSDGQDSSRSGAFDFVQTTTYPATVTSRTNRTYYDGFNIDASRSNSIYGRSDTVQPPALTMRYIIKAFAGASADTTDLAITDLANEVNVLSIKAESNSIVSEGDNYVRYANGLQICYGRFTITLASGNTNGGYDGVVYPLPFRDRPYVALAPSGGYGEYLTIHSEQATNTELRGYYRINTSSHGDSTTVDYITIGRWK